MALHFRNECEHGTVVAQCRCPGEKTVKVVACPTYCRFTPGVPASWDCPHCGAPPSFHPEDVKNRYCAACHHFCDSVGPDGQVLYIVTVAYRGGKGVHTGVPRETVLDEVAKHLAGGATEVKVQPQR